MTYFTGGHLIYSSPPPDLRGNSDIDLQNAQFWRSQYHGILTDGSLGDVDTQTIGTYGQCQFGNICLHIEDQSAKHRIIHVSTFSLPSSFGII